MPLPANTLLTDTPNKTLTGVSDPLKSEALHATTLPKPQSVPEAEQWRSQFFRVLRQKARGSPYACHFFYGKHIFDVLFFLRCASSFVSLSSNYNYVNEKVGGVYSGV